ncbi:BolA/IbaG family iron-sulfur metabolism protein [Sneathiella sp. P13V-1]|uniref:BolA family protein n=1 Tax=Sneathiella sp. P13V-1 TaxID=2697366 RepID=UPI00187B1739|nr:BolA family protein [Sneathiella sp. P13V-1]MBE7638478.1 BolA/IbaG family iron-sulfur metabolism protein [Sneathiella sp. P13V-1]
MSVRDTIESKLRDTFSPEFLEVLDESALHAGHAGAPEGGESHFRVKMIARTFDGEGRVARQRAVYRVLQDEMKNQIHALALELKTPDEI